MVNNSASQASEVSTMQQAHSQLKQRSYYTAICMENMTKNFKGIFFIKKMFDKYSEKHAII